eukprot:366033_1
MGNKQGKTRGFEVKKKALPTSKDGLLVKGYIRLIEEEIKDICVPLAICRSIYRYFQSKNILYWTSPQHIYSVAIDKNDSKERVSQLIKQNQCYCPAVCYKANINIHIPQCINNEPVNAIFKCGGIASDRSLLSDCFATILSPPNINKDEKFIANVSLPSLPLNVASNCLVYSNYYGLLSVGGFIGTYNNWNSLPRRYISNVYQLQLNTYNIHRKTRKTDEEFKWNELTKLKECRGYSSAEIIKINNNFYGKEKLIVIGGDLETGNTYSNSCEIYDFVNKSWKYLRSMAHGRICSGIHYDININCCYVGGGYCDSRIEKYSNFKNVEVYSCIKNKWYPFPDTKLKHAFYPYLWKHNNLLFIASAYSTGLEYIDLRIGMSWTAIYGEKNKKTKKIWNLFKKNNITNTGNSGAICSGRLVG